MTDAPRRDESTDALLRRVLSPGQEPETTDACLDGEIAAAWLDGRIHGAVLEHARTHVADCARCQALMATLVKAESGLAQPAAVAEPKIVETTPRRTWWMWVVPVAAAAAVIVIAVALPRRPGPVATAPAPAPASEPPKMADAKNAAVETPPVEEKKAEAPKVDAKDVNQTAKLGTKKRQQDAQVRPAPAPAGAAARSANEVAAAAPPPPTQPTPSPMAARDEGRLREIVQAPPLRRDEIGSPDPMIRWRLRRRTVEKSIDGGKSWAAVPTGIDAEWTAGAAPSPTAFWIVGRGGMVARSIDGRAFERIPFPELTDLSGVQATDAQNATISSADGHTFTTTDGGRSWARRNLQEN